MLSNHRGRRPRGRPLTRIAACLVGISACAWLAGPGAATALAGTHIWGGKPADYLLIDPVAAADRVITYQIDLVGFNLFGGKNLSPAELADFEDGVRQAFRHLEPGPRTDRTAVRRGPTGRIGRTRRPRDPLRPLQPQRPLRRQHRHLHGPAPGATSIPSCPSGSTPPRTSRTSATSPWWPATCSASRTSNSSPATGTTFTPSPCTRWGTSWAWRTSPTPCGPVNIIISWACRPCCSRPPACGPPSGSAGWPPKSAAPFWRPNCPPP